jgi:hypothetical protein
MVSLLFLLAVDALNLPDLVEYGMYSSFTEVLSKFHQTQNPFEKFDYLLGPSTEEYAHNLLPNIHVCWPIPLQPYALLHIPFLFRKERKGKEIGINIGPVSQLCNRNR